jgi:hypothetical protein
MNPYFLMATLYLSLAVLVALDASLTSLNLLPWFNGLRWLRIHLITLGGLTEVIFGFLSAWAAAPRSSGTRLDIWSSLNVGLLTLLIGIPLYNQALIFTGGTLVFVATVLLIQQLSKKSQLSGEGRCFYIAGLSYFLLGIIVGTGLWLGWSQTLRIAVPVEVHIHANNWGFMSLLFAGLLVDLYPQFANRPFAWPHSIRPIFWMMTLGALGLVLGPWFQSIYFSVPGLILHLTATIWLLLNVIKPLLGDGEAWTAGMWHLVTSYVWILAPVLMAPLVIFELWGFSGAGIEANAPQALIYGWVLQFGYALLPYLFARFFVPSAEPKLGGTWFSLLTVHAGGILLWASIFIEPYQNVLHGLAYLLWAGSMLPIVAQLWRLYQAGMTRLEPFDSSIPTNPILTSKKGEKLPCTSSI